MRLHRAVHDLRGGSRRVSAGFPSGAEALTAGRHLWQILLLNGPRGSGRGGAPRERCLARGGRATAAGWRWGRSWCGWSPKCGCRHRTAHSDVWSSELGGRGRATTPRAVVGRSQAWPGPCCILSPGGLAQNCGASRRESRDGPVGGRRVGLFKGAAGRLRYAEHQQLSEAVRWLQLPHEAGDGGHHAEHGGWSHGCCWRCWAAERPRGVRVFVEYSNCVPAGRVAGGPRPPGALLSCRAPV